MPVELTAPASWFVAELSVTAPLPAATVVAPATNAGPVWLTASLLVLTLRLAAALPAAPMAPSWVATPLTRVTAPVPDELIAPLSWFVAVLRVTVPVPAMIVVRPAIVSVPADCSTGALTVLNSSCPAVTPAPKAMPAVPSVRRVTGAVPLFRAAAMESTPAASAAPEAGSTARSEIAPLAVVIVELTRMLRPAWAVRPAACVDRLTGLLKVMSSRACRITVVPAASSVAGAIVCVEAGLIPNVATSVVAARPEEATTMLSGSSSQVPGVPAAADAVTWPTEIVSPCLPEVSTDPPSPPSAPPRAVMLPLKVVEPSAQTTTLPPSPRVSGIGTQLRAGHDDRLFGVANLRIDALEVSADPDALLRRRLPETSTSAAAIDQHLLALHGDVAAALAGGEAGRVEPAGNAR